MAYGDPGPMVSFRSRRGRVGERKWCLFSAARAVTNPAVSLEELDTLEAAAEAREEVMRDVSPHLHESVCITHTTITSIGGRPVDAREAGEVGREALVRQAATVRDIFGNPFRPAALAPEWRTPNVTDLAAIYADRAFDRLPVLADALEESGCDHPDILAHCRGGGPHPRGCWVVDLVLGKE